MRYVIIDSQSDKLDNLKTIGERYSVREDFDSSESFSKILMNEVQSKIGSSNIPKELAAAIGMNTMVAKISKNDLCILASLDAKKGKGGFRLISCPELQMENHLLVWSESYGVMALSREPISEQVEKMETQFFIIFECMPPYILGCEPNKGLGFSIIREISDKEFAEKQSSIIGDFATVIFKNWDEYHREEEITKQNEFCFLFDSKDIEC